MTEEKFDLENIPIADHIYLIREGFAWVYDERQEVLLFYNKGVDVIKFSDLPEHLKYLTKNKDQPIGLDGIPPFYREKDD